MAERNQGPVGVLTISDKASQGKREDQSGEAAVRILEEAGFSSREIAELRDQEVI